MRMRAHGLALAVPPPPLSPHSSLSPCSALLFPALLCSAVLSLAACAGTKTYEERRQESQKIMVNTDKQRDQIQVIPSVENSIDACSGAGAAAAAVVPCAAGRAHPHLAPACMRACTAVAAQIVIPCMYACVPLFALQEVIDFIETRLKELEEEKAELKEFEGLDSDRRCLEYAIYENEALDATKKLEQIEQTRSKAAGNATQKERRKERKNKERKKERKKNTKAKQGAQIEQLSVAGVRLRG